MAEYLIELNGRVESSNSTYPSGTPAFATFDIDTLSGTINFGVLSNGALATIDADNLSITNFSATIGGVPVSALPFATAHMAGDCGGGPCATTSSQAWRTTLDVNTVFGWDFLTQTPVITTSTSDPVAAWFNGFISTFNGDLDGYQVSWAPTKVINLTPGLAEPSGLSLFGAALLAFVCVRILRRWSSRRPMMVLNFSALTSSNRARPTGRPRGARFHFFIEHASALLRRNVRRPPGTADARAPLEARPPLDHPPCDAYRQASGRSKGGAMRALLLALALMPALAYADQENVYDFVFNGVVYDGSPPDNTASERFTVTFLANSPTLPFPGEGDPFSASLNAYDVDITIGNQMVLQDGTGAFAFVARDQISYLPGESVGYFGGNWSFSSSALTWFGGLESGMHFPDPLNAIYTSGGQVVPCTVSGFVGNLCEVSGHSVAVPEPGTLALLAFSLAGLILTRRRPSAA
jgi:hypothetical protein